MSEMEVLAFYSTEYFNRYADCNRGGRNPCNINFFINDLLRHKHVSYLCGEQVSHLQHLILSLVFTGVRVSLIFTVDYFIYLV
jgi:hypothetical protein